MFLLKSKKLAKKLKGSAAELVVYYDNPHSAKSNLQITCDIYIMVIFICNQVVQNLELYIGYLSIHEIN